MNAARGEAGLEAGGRRLTLCLTLGALAEIETEMGVASLAELPERLARLKAGDLVVLLRALLRGGGEREAADAVERLDVAPDAAAKAIACAFERAGFGG